MSWSWFSSGGSNCSSQSGIVTTKTVRTCDGRTIVTRTYNGQPETTSCPMGNNPTTTSEAQESSNTPAISDSSATGASRFEQESLDEHNRLRARHGCPPLTLNRSMCAYALEWANNLARRNTMQHRSERRYGENLYMASGQNVDGKMPVKSWYDEISMYNYSRPGFSSSTGHFTQVVWKGSQELGVAIVTRGNTSWVVANYSPAGNFQNQFGANVPNQIR